MHRWRELIWNPRRCDSNGNGSSSSLLECGQGSSFPLFYVVMRAMASSIMLGMHFERAMKPTMTTAAAAAKAVVGSGSALVRDNNANQTTIAILQPNDDTRKSFFVDVLNSQMLSQG